MRDKEGKRVDPQTTIGKYVAFDSPGGAVWAKVAGYQENEQGEGRLITEHLYVQSGSSVRRLKEKRLLCCDYLDGITVIDMTVFEIPKGLEEELFLKLIKGEEIKGALALGIKDMKGKLDPLLAEKVQSDMDSWERRREEGLSDLSKFFGS